MSASAPSRSRWRNARSRPRVLASLAVGAVAAVVTGVLGAWAYSPLVGWDFFAATFSAWLWASIAPMGGGETEAHARREDPGQAGSDALVLLASVASLAAVGAILVSAQTGKGSNIGPVAGLALGSVALSWLVVHTLFTLRYARLYHAQGGGVDFNQKEPPRYIDFAYLAFTIGMTFQVSDTDIRTTTIRGAALRHAVISYLFGAVILATTVNLVASITTGGG